MSQELLGRSFFKESSSFKFSDIKLSAYDGKREELYSHFKNWDGKQDGNPKKFAIQLFKVLEMSELPLRVLISKSAFSQIDEYYIKRYESFKALKKYYDRYRI